MSIALIGIMGAGKTSTGRLLARNLGVEFCDVDTLIEEEAGKPISEIFVEDGEPYFRDLERRLTLDALQRGGVVSLGGGAVTSLEIREALRAHEVVWLQVSITQATRRVGIGAARPMLMGNVRSRLVTLMRDREPLYRAVATRMIDTDHQRPAAVAAALAEELR